MNEDKIQACINQIDAAEKRISKLNAEVEELEAVENRMRDSDGRISSLQQSLLADVERAFQSADNIGVMRKFRVEMEKIIMGAAYAELVASAAEDKSDIRSEIQWRLDEIEELEVAIMSADAQLSELRMAEGEVQP